MDAQPGSSFNVGEMSDPSEVLLLIYECMGKVPALRVSHTDDLGDSNVPMVDTFFGLRLHEALHCQFCNVVSHKLDSHMEFFLIIQATALRALVVSGGS